MVASLCNREWLHHLVTPLASIQPEAHQVNEVRGEAKTLGLEIHEIIKQIVKVGDGDGTSPLSPHLKSATGLATIDCNTQELDNNNTNNKRN